ncbi:unnamed protein product [Rotaria magnacalcarata]
MARSKGQCDDAPWATLFEDSEMEVEEQSISPLREDSTNQPNQYLPKKPLENDHNTNTHQNREKYSSVKNGNNSAPTAPPVTIIPPTTIVRDSDGKDENEQSLPNDKKDNSNKLSDRTPSSTSLNISKAKNDLKDVKYILPTRDDLVSVHPDIVLERLKLLSMDNDIDSIGIEIIQQKEPPIWLLHANSVQHEEMTDIVHRMHDLERCTLRQIRTFIDKIEDSVRMFGKNVKSCAHLRTKNGKTFVKHLNMFLDEKEKALKEEFEKDITDKCRSLVVKGSIINTAIYGRELEYYAQVYLQWKSIERHFEDFKRKAFHAFIKDSKQNWKLEKYDTETDHILNQHLERLEKVFSSDLYVGIEEKQIALIPAMLLRVEVFCRCAQQDLELFKSSSTILSKINKHTVISISTATGSGKSTLLPALLAADGYEKIIVTQPRRLACNSISDRVNKTIGKISSWAVAGARSKNDHNTHIMYLTDGLLTQYLQYNEGKIISEAANCVRGTVFFIDEVHERSVNIDLCLAFLAKLLQLDFEGKVKVILSSATLDNSVQELFQKFNNDYFALKIESTLRFPVHTSRIKINETMFDLIERLKKDCKKNEQILCFVKSNNDVTQSIDLLKQLKKIDAFPLIELQSSIVQQKLVAEEQIFFSTTVAQTSLTFPSLKYVIDTGIINIPIYDPHTDTTVLTQIPASHSTITQRKGRLGRTQRGEYFPLYNSHVKRLDFPTPQICQTELSNVDFALRKSSEEKDSLETFKQWLPDQPDQAIIVRACDRLKKLGILVDGKQFTQKGKDIAQLPDFGTLELSTSVHAALNKYNCGRDVILLAAILSVLNTPAIIPKLPNKYKRPEEGDYMSLLDLMHDLSSQPTSINDPELADIQHHLRRALIRLKTFEAYFSNTSTKSEWQKAAKISSDNWYNIAQALLDGYWEKVYVSLDRLQGRNGRYVRYSETPEEFDDDRKQTAVLKTTTIISRERRPECVFARDILCSTAIRATSLISFLGIIPAAWLTHEIERKVKVTATEMTKFKEKISDSIDRHITYSTAGHEIIFKGPTGKVFDTEQHVREQLCNEYEWFLPDKESLKNNSMLRTNMPKVKRCIFMPFLWRWQNEKQVQNMNIEKESPTLLKIVATCREKDARSIKAELNSFFNRLSQCESFQNEQKNNVQPQQLKPSNSGIEQRIKRVTDPNRTWADLKPAVSQGTRESRMDVIAWTVVCKFHCKLHGAFVRDRIINNRVSPSSDANPESWIDSERKTDIPVLHSKIAPSTIDCHLPIDKYFDIEHLLDEIHKYEDITVEVFPQNGQYVLLFDRKALTGPFILNLTEPHIALTQGRIDFDINNLYVERGHTQELGQRVDLSGPPCSSDLEEIVKKIRMYHFKVLRPIDDGRVRESLEKLKSQGYSQDGPPLTLYPSKSS